MDRLFEIKVPAMALTVSGHATLASHLLHSQPPVLADDDDGLAEALRRDADMDVNPSMCLTYEEFKRELGR